MHSRFVEYSRPNNTHESRTYLLLFNHYLSIEMTGTLKLESTAIYGEKTKDDNANKLFFTLFDVKNRTVLNC